MSQVGLYGIVPAAHETIEQRRLVNGAQRN